MSADEKKEIVILSDWIKNNPNKIFLMVGESLISHAQRAADSFLNYPNVKTIHISRFKTGELNNFKPQPLSWRSHYTFEKIDYFIFPKEIKITLENVEKKENLSGALWQVFENQNNQRIPSFKR